MGVFVTGAGKIPKKVNYVGWIQSTGTQYIDTEFKPNQDTRVVIDIEVTVKETSFLYGARNSSSSGAFALAQLTGTSLRSDYNSKDTQIAISTVQRLTVDKNKNITVVNGTTSTIDAQTFECPYNLTLLTVNTAGTIHSTKTKAKLYSCQIYDNGTLVRDFRPCYDPDGVACLYDEVTETYFYNAGTGEFIAGGAA